MKKQAALNNKKVSDTGEKKTILFLALIIIATFILYKKAYNFDFISNWDDDHHIIYNADIKKISVENFRKIFSSYYVGHYQPLVTFTYSIIFSVSGLSPKSYHAFNIFVHLLNIMLVYVFFKKLTGDSASPLLIAMLFSVHPFFTEAVAWVTELKTLLYSFFFLLSLILYLNYTAKNSGKTFLILSYFAFLFSCFSKAQAVTLPLVLFLIDFFRGRKFSLRLITEKIPFLILSFVFGITAINAQKSVGLAEFVFSYSLAERFLILCYSVCFYLVSVIIPFSLSAVHPYPVSLNESLSTIYYISPLILVALLILTVKYMKREKEILFGLGFFLVTISAVLQLIPFGRSMVSERFTYIPYAGLLLSAVFFLNFILKKITIRQKNLTASKSIFFTAVFLVFIIITQNRLGDWQNGFTLFSDLIQKYPAFYLGYHSQGNILLEKNDFQNALKDFDKALRLHPDADAFNSRGICKFNLNDFSGAIRDYDSALILNPSLYDALNNRGNAKAAAGDLHGAVEDFTASLLLNENSPLTYQNRGLAYLLLSEYEKAIKDFDKILAIEPQNARVYFERGNAAFQLHRFSDACRDWKSAAALNLNEAKERISKFCK